MAQLMPLPLTVSCFSKIQIGFTFLVPAHPGSPGQRAVKQVCVCVVLRLRNSGCIMVLFIHHGPTTNTINPPSTLILMAVFLSEHGPASFPSSCLSLCSFLRRESSGLLSPRFLTPTNNIKAVTVKTPMLWLTQLLQTNNLREMKLVISYLVFHVNSKTNFTCSTATYN